MNNYELMIIFVYEWIYCGYYVNHDTLQDIFCC